MSDESPDIRIDAHVEVRDDAARRSSKKLQKDLTKDHEAGERERTAATARESKKRKNTRAAEDKPKTTKRTRNIRETQNVKVKKNVTVDETVTTRRTSRERRIRERQTGTSSPPERTPATTKRSRSRRASAPAPEEPAPPVTTKRAATKKVAHVATTPLTVDETVKAPLTSAQTTRLRTELSRLLQSGAVSVDELLDTVRHGVHMLNKALERASDPKVRNAIQRQGTKLANAPQVEGIRVLDQARTRAGFKEDKIFDDAVKVARTEAFTAKGAAAVSSTPAPAKWGSGRTFAEMKASVVGATPKSAFPDVDVKDTDTIEERLARAEKYGIKESGAKPVRRDVPDTIDTDEIEAARRARAAGATPTPEPTPAPVETKKQRYARIAKQARDDRAANIQTLSPEEREEIATRKSRLPRAGAKAPDWMPYKQALDAVRPQIQKAVAEFYAAVQRQLQQAAALKAQTANVAAPKESAIPENVKKYAHTSGISVEQMVKNLQDAMAGDRRLVLAGTAKQNALAKAAYAALARTMGIEHGNWEAKRRRKKPFQELPLIAPKAPTPPPAAPAPTPPTPTPPPAGRKFQSVLTNSLRRRDGWTMKLNAPVAPKTIGFDARDEALELRELAKAAEQMQRAATKGNTATDKWLENMGAKLTGANKLAQDLRIRLQQIAAEAIKRGGIEFDNKHVLAKTPGFGAALIEEIGRQSKGTRSINVDPKKPFAWTVLPNNASPATPVTGATTPAQPRAAAPGTAQSQATPTTPPPRAAAPTTPTPVVTPTAPAPSGGSPPPTPPPPTGGGFGAPDPDEFRRMLAEMADVFAAKLKAALETPFKNIATSLKSLPTRIAKPLKAVFDNFIAEMRAIMGRVGERPEYDRPDDQGSIPRDRALATGIVTGLGGIMNLGFTHIGNNLGAIALKLDSLRTAIRGGAIDYERDENGEVLLDDDGAPVKKQKKKRYRVGDLGVEDYEAYDGTIRERPKKSGDRFLDVDDREWHAATGEELDEPDAKTKKKNRDWHNKLFNKSKSYEQKLEEKLEREREGQARKFERYKVGLFNRSKAKEHAAEQRELRAAVARIKKLNNRKKFNFDDSHLFAMARNAPSLATDYTYKPNLPKRVLKRFEAPREVSTKEWKARMADSGSAARGEFANMDLKGLRFGGFKGIRGASGQQSLEGLIGSIRKSIDPTTAADGAAYKPFTTNGASASVDIARVTSSLKAAQAQAMRATGIFARVFTGFIAGAKALPSLIDRVTGSMNRLIAASTRYTAVQKRANGQFNIFNQAGAVFIGLGLHRMWSAVLAKVSATRQEYIELEQMMQQIASISPEFPTDAKLEDYKQNIKKRSVELAVSPVDLGKAAYEAMQTNIEDPELALNLATMATKGAKLGNTDPTTVISGLVAVMNAYQLVGDDVQKTTLEAARVMDQLFVLVRNGAIKWDQLTDSLGNYITTANALGFSMQETFAAMATLTKQGLNPGKASTALNQMLNALIHSRQAAEDFAATMGIEMSGISVNQRGLVGILGQVNAAITANKDAAMSMANAGDYEGAISELARGSENPYMADILSTMFPDTRDLRAVSALTGKAFEDFIKDLRDVNKAAEGHGEILDNVWKRYTKSIPFRLEQLKKRFDNVSTSIWQKTMPTFITLGEVVANSMGGIATSFTEGLVGPIKLLAILAKSMEHLTGLFAGNEIGKGMSLMGEGIAKLAGNVVMLTAALTAMNMAVQYMRAPSMFQLEGEDGQMRNLTKGQRVRHEILGGLTLPIRAGKRVGEKVRRAWTGDVSFAEEAAARGFATHADDPWGPTVVPGGGSTKKKRRRGLRAPISGAHSSIRGGVGRVVDRGILNPLAMMGGLAIDAMNPFAWGRGAKRAKKYMSKVPIATDLDVRKASFTKIRPSYAGTFRSPYRDERREWNRAELGKMHYGRSDFAMSVRSKTSRAVDAVAMGTVGAIEMAEMATGRTKKAVKSAPGKAAKAIKGGVSNLGTNAVLGLVHGIDLLEKSSKKVTLANVKTAGTGVANVAKNAGRSVLGLAGNLVKAGATFGIWGMAAGAAAGALVFLGIQVAKNTDGIGSMFTKMWENGIKPVLLGLAQGVWEAINRVLEYLSIFVNFWQSIVAIIASPEHSLGTKLVDIFKSIGAAAIDTVQWVLKTFGDLIDGIGFIIRNGAVAIRRANMFILDTFIDLVFAIKAKWDELSFESIVEKIKALPGKIIEGLKWVKEKVTNGIQNGLSWAKGVGKSILGFLGLTGDDGAIEGAKDAFKGAKDALSGGYQNLYDWVKRKNGEAKYAGSLHGFEMLAGLRDGPIGAHQLDALKKLFDEVGLAHDALLKDMVLDSTELSRLNLKVMARQLLGGLDNYDFFSWDEFKSKGMGVGTAIFGPMVDHLEEVQRAFGMTFEQLGQKYNFEPIKLTLGSFEDFLKTMNTAIEEVGENTDEGDAMRKALENLSQSVADMDGTLAGKKLDQNVTIAPYIEIITEGEVGSDDIRRITDAVQTAIKEDLRRMTGRRIYGGA